MKISPLVFTWMILFSIPQNPVYSQGEKAQDLRQYLFPDFAVSVVTTKTGKPNNLLLNYNTVSEKMVFEQKGQHYDLVNQGVVDTVYMNGKRFIPLESFFIEVATGGPVPFGIQHKSNLLEPGKPAGYGTTSKLAASNYLSSVKLSSGYYNLKLPEGYEVNYSPVYWVRKEGVWHRFTGEKQYLKIFPEKSAELKLFIKNNRLKMDQAGDLLKLAQFCNDLYK